MYVVCDHLNIQRTTNWNLSQEFCAYKKMYVQKFNYVSVILNILG